MKAWQIATANNLEPDDFPGISPLLLQLLHNRGLDTPGLIKEFFSPPAYHDPFLFRDMAAAVDLIIQHIKAGDKMTVYGDYDADGVTSSVVLLEALQVLHGQAEVYLPDRVSEGYGLNKPAIDAIAVAGSRLIITVDNGIRNKEEVAYARSLGLDVIVTDHHVLPEHREDMPDCPVIDPADPEDNYPWRYLAGVGVAFKLVSALLAKANLPDSQKQLIKERSLDLVAVGTVSDMVSLLGENRALVRDGLRLLNKGKRLGLVELAHSAKANGNRPLQAWNIGWQLGPRLNAASRLAHANTAFALLTAGNPVDAKELAAELNRRNCERQDITARMMAEVEEQIDKDNLPLVIIGVAKPGQEWNEGVVGLVAGRITEKYYRPSLVIARIANDSEEGGVQFKGSGRSVEEFNLIEAVEAGNSFLHKYGGHPMACGFSIKDEESLGRFKEIIVQEASKRLDASRLVPKLKIEAELPFADISLSLAEEIDQLAPFGQNNPEPRLASYGLRIDDIVTMGADNQHIKFRLTQPGGDAKAYWALAFGAAAEYASLHIGDQIDIAYYLDINDFNGRREPQLKIIDIKLKA